jgi:hypothetical protein
MMKRIKNDSLQTFVIYLNTEAGEKEMYVKPKESIVVPQTYITEQVNNLHRRRLFKITNA